MHAGIKVWTYEIRRKHDISGKEPLLKMSPPATAKPDIYTSGVKIIIKL